MDIKITLNWQITTEQRLDIDPVLFQLLESIQNKGSLSQAVTDTSVSYRFAWGLLSKWEQHLGKPLVLMERGRGASLTTLGETLLNAQRQLTALYLPELDNFSTRYKREFETILLEDQSPSLNIFASHGLAIGLLRDLINQSSNFKLDLHFQGSIEGLRSLSDHSCDVAGFHIPVGKLGEKLSSNYLPWINRKTHQLIYVVKRNQGLMVQKGNPKNINSINSLTDPDVSFVNRQVNSGTRLLFDLLLENDGISPAQITGYLNEEFTHMAVAAMVASGAADACFGIAPMADKFQLEFIPQVWEHYCLAVPNKIAEDDRVLEIKKLLQGQNFQQTLAGFTGYDTSRSGSVVNFTEIFSN